MALSTPWWLCKSGCLFIKHPNVPDGMPGVAWHGGLSKDIHTPLPAATTQATRRGLYATMSYVDDCVGKVLSELTALGLANDTIVVSP